MGQGAIGLELNSCCGQQLWYPGEPSVIDVFFQWPFQEPKLEVPTIYKAYKAVYIRPKFQGISPQNMVLYGTVPPF